MSNPHLHPHVKPRTGLGFLFLFVGVCLLWRLDYVALLGVRSPPVPLVIASLAGALWIDSLLAGVLISALVLASGRGPLARILGRATVVLVFAWVCAARLADRGYFFYSGDHVDPLAIEHLEGNALGMRLDPRVLAYLVVGSSISVVAFVLLCLAARRARSCGLIVFMRRALLPAGMVAGIGWVASEITVKLCDDEVLATRLADLQAAPEIRILILVATRNPSLVPRPEGMFLLDPLVKRKLRRFGIVIDESQEYPLIKARTFERPLGFVKTGQWVEKPNVIVVFFESFSTALTSIYNAKRFPGLTPNLEDMARVSCVVEDFFNASTPTVTSLVCCYGSYLPVTNTQTWYLEENNSGKTRLHCLPHILGELGWNSTHVHSLANEFVRTGEAVSRLGFTTVVDGPQIGRALGETQAHWGYSDHQIFRYVVHQLKTGKLAEPFLLSVATVDSHAPFLPSREGPKYADGDNPLLSSLHSADHAFGTFWNWFKDSEYFGNTIVVATADHAMFPGKEHAELRPDEDMANRYYDRVMLCIHDPMHELPRRLRVVSSQLDLTPTLLHLLGINVKNHFEGHSLFGTRQPHPGVLGMHEYLFGIYQPVTGGGVRLDNFRREDVEQACRGTTFDPTTDELSRCEYFHYFRWKRALHIHNRVWR